MSLASFAHFLPAVRCSYSLRVAGLLHSAEVDDGWVSLNGRTRLLLSVLVGIGRLADGLDGVMLPDSVLDAKRAFGLCLSGGGRGSSESGVAPGRCDCVCLPGVLVSKIINILHWIISSS